MEGFDVTCILLLCIILLISLLWFYNAKDLPGIPGHSPWPIIGNVIQINRLTNGSTRENFVKELKQKYGNVCKLFLGPHPLVVVQGFDFVSEILSSKDFIDRPNWLPGIKKMRQVTGGNGIVFENGEEWKERRKFAMRTMKDFGVGKSSVEERILDEIQNITEHFGKMEGKEVTDVKQVMACASCNVIHGIIFGFRYEHGEQALSDLLDHVGRIFSGPGFVSMMSVYPILNMFYVDSLLKRREGYKKLTTYIDLQITEHRQTFQKDNIRDFVDYFLEAEQNQDGSKAILTTNSLFNIIVDLFIAGIDTTSTTLNWSILYMMEYPDVQKKCQEEIAKVIGSGRNVRLSDRKSLPYVEATIMEIQRIANIVPFALPHVATSDTTIGQYKIPERCIVMASIQSAHFDRALWEKPENFNPGRFLNNEMEIINKEYLLSFSMGPRVCLGESLAKSEIFLIFSNLIQKFTFSKVDKNETLSFEGEGGITRQAKPFKVSVTQRV